MMRPLFFTGMHRPSKAGQLERCMVSLNVLEGRRSGFAVNDWILDSGAFTRLATGRGHAPVAEYAEAVNRWGRCGNLLAAVAQDYMCEPAILEVTGLTVADHQRLTLDRYDELLPLTSPYILPVLQGFEPSEYVAHLAAYGNRLGDGQWVGVGSICKRNGTPASIVAVLRAIKNERPDLQLHAFGIKKTALKVEAVNNLIYSCDSMAWSYNARKNNRDANAVEEAVRYANAVANIPIQLELPCVT
jgi:hypothetical protein